MKSHSYKLMLLVIFAYSLPAFPQAPADQPAQLSHPEEVEWTWEVRPTHVDTKLPNVLLVGDSITRNYYPEVQRQLTGAANVYLFAASTSVGDPRLIHQLAEFSSMQDVHFQVVHFNNGMHGWTYSEADFRAAFPSFLSELHTIAPNASFVWASITPVKSESQPGPTNARIDLRNGIALTFIGRQDIRVDDQHELMTHHADQYEDNVHFNPVGAALQGQQAARSIQLLLGK